MTMKDIQEMLDRFDNLRKLQIELGQETLSAIFTEHDLKLVVYMLGELLYAKENDIL